MLAVISAVLGVIAASRYREERAEARKPLSGVARKSKPRLSAPAPVSDDPLNVIRNASPELRDAAFARLHQRRGAVKELARECEWWEQTAKKVRAGEDHTDEIARRLNVLQDALRTRIGRATQSEFMSDLLLPDRYMSIGQEPEDTARMMERRAARLQRIREKVESGDLDMKPAELSGMSRAEIGDLRDALRTVAEVELETRNRPRLVAIIDGHTT